MRQKFSLGALLALAIALGIAIAVNPGSASADSYSQQPSNSNGAVSSLSSGPSLPVTGMPAIRTMPGMAVAQANAQTGTKQITQAIVVQFVQQTGLPHTLPGSSLSAVTSAKLLTSKEISNLLHGEETGLPDSKLLWYVTMQGTFILPTYNGSVTAHRGYEVFDPDTGNLIMCG